MDAPERSKPIAIDDALLRNWPLPTPAADGDKEDRGRVLVIAGSREIPGAAILAATAALRAGAGKVTIGTAASIAQSIAVAVPESRTISLEETPDGGVASESLAVLDELKDKTKVVLIGPGLPYDRETRDCATALITRFSKAHVVLDAGAMAAAKTFSSNLTSLPARVLLTPHAGEMAGLRGCDKKSIEADPQRAALDAARELNAVIALKGATTHIAGPDGRVWRHDGGMIGLATSGSGDVLSGIIAGLLARGSTLEQASAWAVALHARAGAKLAGRIGPLGYLARELAAEVPVLIAGLSA